MPSGFVQPTSWNLFGGGIHVSYSVAGPTFIYQDPHRVLHFTGGQIRVVDVPDIGVLVSVTIILTVDTGSTTFTLVLPRVNLPAPPALPSAVPVTTEAITTVHHFSLIPSLQHGQQDFYRVTTLHGTAV
jgi:hypothetical protein